MARGRSVPLQSNASKQVGSHARSSSVVPNLTFSFLTSLEQIVEEDVDVVHGSQIRENSDLVVRLRWNGQWAVRIVEAV